VGGCPADEPGAEQPKQSPARVDAGEATGNSVERIAMHRTPAFRVTPAGSNAADMVANNTKLSSEVAGVWGGCVSHRQAEGSATGARRRLDRVRGGFHTCLAAAWHGGRPT